MLMGPSPSISLLSGSDLLKHITKRFSVNHFLNQQLVLGVMSMPQTSASQGPYIYHQQYCVALTTCFHG